MRMSKFTNPSRPPGVHWAFLYSLGMPGLGEYLLGARVRGILTMALVLGCLAWSCWALADLVNSLFDLRTPSFSTFVQLALSLGCILFIWLWGMLAAVDVAIQRGLRRENEYSPFWAVLMSWFCPGTGQLYTGARAFGFGLFACYLVATFFLFPAYKLMLDSLRSMLSSGTLQASPVQAVMLIHEVVFRLDYGVAKLSVMTIESVSMLLAAAALQPVWYGHFRQAKQRRLLRGPDGRPLSERELPFAQRTEARVLCILALGWLCPGSGQLLLKQRIAGWSLFCLYLFGKIGIGVLLTTHTIGYETAQSWTWIPAITRLVSMGLGLLTVTARPKAAETPMPPADRETPENNDTGHDKGSGR